MRPTFDKLSQDAPTILNGTNEYEYVLVGTFHSVHNYHSCPPFPIQLFGWGSYPLEYLCIPKISHRAGQGDAALSGGTRRATVAGFSLNLFRRNEFISPPAEHIVREIDGTPPRNSSSILRGDRHCRVCNCACARPAGKERDKTDHSKRRPL